MTSSFSSRIVCCGIVGHSQPFGDQRRSLAVGRLAVQGVGPSPDPAHGCGTRSAGARRSGVAATAVATSAWSCSPPAVEKLPLARKAKCSSSGPSTTPTSPTTPSSEPVFARSFPASGLAAEALGERPGLRRDREALVDRRELRAARELDDLQHRPAGDPVVGREAGAVVHDEAGGRDRRGDRSSLDDDAGPRRGGRRRSPSEPTARSRSSSSAV